MVLTHCGLVNQWNILEGSAHVSGRNECYEGSNLIDYGDFDLLL